MHPSRLRWGRRPLTDASPGSARSPGLRVCRAAPSRHRNIHTHAPFRTECQFFLRCRDMRLADFARAAVGRAAALRRQRSGVRIPSGAPLQNKKENRTADAFVDIIAALPSDTAYGSSHKVRSRRKALPARSPRRAERQGAASCATKRRRRSQIRSGRRTGRRTPDRSASRRNRRTPPSAPQSLQRRALLVVSRPCRLDRLEYSEHRLFSTRGIESVQLMFASTDCVGLPHPPDRLVAMPPPCWSLDQA